MLFCLKSQGIYPHISIPDMGRKLKEQEIAHEKNKDSLVFYDSYHDLDEVNMKHILYLKFFFTSLIYNHDTLIIWMIYELNYCELETTIT